MTNTSTADYYSELAKDYHQYMRLKMTETGNMASVIGCQKAIISILCDTLREYGAKKHRDVIAHRVDFAERNAKECEYVFENRDRADYHELINEIRATADLYPGTMGDESSAPR